VRKTRKTDKNQFLPKSHTTKHQLLKKLKESNFNFHNPEVRVQISVSLLKQTLKHQLFNGFLLELHFENIDFKTLK
jgi:hypothetical protein